MALHKHFTGPNVALVSVFAALVAASTLIPAVSLAGGVPITLQTFAVILAGAVLGPWRGASAVLLYLVVGTAGAPIFAGHVGGPSVWAGPTGGFLAAFIPAAFVTGWIVRAVRRRGRLNLGWLLLACGLGSLVVLNVIGWTWFAIRLGFDLPATLAVALPFVPGDVIKVVAAAGTAWAVHRAYPGILPATERREAATSRATTA
ncbi:biotin transporter BioY [Demequina zhanjiangensis]|uniref:Biotin transporter n=1 Tax=Demequina zhanjiangensis TaxID=3051659 RepID=A0ABT8G1T5_9MICO|nr:biotin transporter BioY [Demequina sp. SYSU T00b26]MDN4473091.1 biotin transporter BioY [Demequina sp. SYSU T00b26]